MSLVGTVRDLVSILDAANVSYMVAGSVASTLHGEPRSTQNIDLAVEMEGSTLRALLGMLPEHRYYVSTEAAVDALRRRGQFNIIDMESGWKADIIVRKSRPFSRMEFSRRMKRSAFGIQLCVASAEDVVLSKLEWSVKMGGSERQLRDVRGVIAANKDTLDLVYLRRWGDELKVREALDDLLR